MTVAQLWANKQINKNKTNKNEKKQNKKEKTSGVV